MSPLLRFASGIVVGIIGAQLLRQSKAPDAVKSFAQKARSGLDKASEELRDAAVSGLSAVEKSSASLRAKLAGDSEQAAAEASEPVETTTQAPPPEPAPESSASRPNEKA